MAKFKQGRKETIVKQHAEFKCTLIEGLAGLPDDVEENYFFKENSQEESSEEENSEVESSEVEGEDSTVEKTTYKFLELNSAFEDILVTRRGLQCQTFALGSLESLKFRTSVLSLQRKFSLKFLWVRKKFGLEKNSLLRSFYKKNRAISRFLLIKSLGSK